MSNLLELSSDSAVFLEVQIGDLSGVHSSELEVK